MAATLPNVDLVVLDELGYLPFSQNWMAASEDVGLRPLLPMGDANHCMPLPRHTVNEPLALRALLYSRQLVVLY
jgi:hypothetical protein